MKFIAKFATVIRSIAEFVPAKEIKRYHLCGYVKIAADRETNRISVSGLTPYESYWYCADVAVVGNQEVIESGECVYLISDLLAMLKKAKAARHALIRFDDAIVNVSGSSVSVKVKTLPIDEFPKLDLPDFDWANSIELDTEKMTDIHRTVSYAVSEDKTRQVLTGLHFTDNCVETTDGHRLVRFHNFAGSKTANTGNHDFVFPASSFNRVHSLLDANGFTWNISLKLAERDQIALKTTRSEFSSQQDSWVFSVRSIEGRYPNLAQLVPAAFRERIVLNRKQWVRALETLQAALVDTDIVTISHFENGTCILSGEALPIAGVEVEAHIAQSTDALKKTAYSFNINYLLEALQACMGDAVSFSFNSSKNPAVLRCVADETHLIMPIAIRKDSDRVYLVEKFKAHFPTV